jgi:anti-anti-sigma factor
VARQGSIEVEIHSSKVSIVTLHGEHDMHSQAEVARALTLASATSSMLVDFSPTTFVDSSIVKVLLRASNTLHRLGGVLELVVPSSPHVVRRVLDLMSLHDLLPSHHTREAGIEQIEHRNAQPVFGRGVRFRALVELLEEAPADKESRRRAA